MSSTNYNLIRKGSICTSQNKPNSDMLSPNFLVKYECLFQATSPLCIVKISSYMLYLFPNVMSAKYCHRFSTFFVIIEQFPLLEYCKILSTKLFKKNLSNVFQTRVREILLCDFHLKKLKLRGLVDRCKKVHFFFKTANTSLLVSITSYT